MDSNEVSLVDPVYELWMWNESGGFVDPPAPTRDVRAFFSLESVNIDERTVCPQV